MVGYFPLFVEYQERLYAGGRIKGSRWVKREGRPSDDEILSGRLIDRSIRPLFPKTYKKEVQVMATVLSVDMENDPTIVAALGTSAAIAISQIPWKEVVVTLRVGKIDGKYAINPLISLMVGSSMDLIVSVTEKSILMVEAGTKEVTEEEILEGIEFAQKEGKAVIKFINEFAEVTGKKKETVPADEITTELKSKIKKIAGDKLEEILKEMALHEGSGGIYSEVKSAVIAGLSEEKPDIVAGAFEKVLKEEARKITLKGKRVDGRKFDEVRTLFGEVGILPRTHGSAIFSRGQTQVLTIATLGAPSLGQLIESAEGEESKHYMHHYSMPPFSTGEVGKVGSPNRREIGHGALAERALFPVIPTEDKFPYTIRLVSEVMSSNGSTSMASTCGSTLALMDAGVPITSPVSGIAMGLVIDGKDHAVLTDICGMEDYLVGDMDFKVTGTAKGITALQLDVKTLELTHAILKEAITQSKKARAEVLKAILATLKEPREKVSAYAPKIRVVMVPVEKIGEIIGPGGKIIKRIIAETGAQVEVEDDGSVNISGIDGAKVDAAVTMVENLVKEVKAGEIYEGEVVRIQPFGAFIQILPGKDGMVHVSDMGEGFVKDPNDVVKIGQKVQVRVKEIDDLGRINLSMNMDPTKDKPKEDRGPRRESGFRGNDRGGFGGGRSFGDRGGSFGGPRRDFSPRPRFGSDRSSGPHFPTSRLADDGKKDFGR
ncbi:MAG: polyribonucleotide nucleotidyltransferase [Candidatus Woesebacteria bacterium]|nr:polyribonucleotide nucleotidyltransferase [Candidatus Woesebacteria bacterium]